MNDCHCEEAEGRRGNLSKNRPEIASVADSDLAMTRLVVLVVLVVLVPISVKISDSRFP